MTRRALLLAALLVPMRARAQAAPPAEVVERFHAALLAGMRDAARLGVRGREGRLRPVMQAAFDLPAMARIAIGPPWSQLAEADRQALAAAFADWSIATYASRFDGFAGESFRTLGEQRLANGDTLVRTELLVPNDKPVVLSYLLREAAGAWRIVDIYLTGTISELASRRAEFTALLRDGGAPRLLAELRGRTQRLLGG